MDVQEQVSINIKYAGYIRRQLKQVEQFRKMESKKIPEDLDYDQVGSLRIEAVQKLKEYRPLNIGQASRISGVSPADISVLLVYLESRQKRNGKNRAGRGEDRMKQYDLTVFEKGLSDLNITLTDGQKEQFLSIL